MRFHVHSLVALLTCIALAACVAACSPPASDDAATQTHRSPGASEDATAQAQSTLRDFFAAWQAKDERAAENYLAPYRQGVTWQFERLD
ncbi:MAG: hypothetical protein Q8K99_03610 [Actinomycetota bacterium]|nr:hypothetical protein [Actinomycetota bacterium]